MRVIDRDQFERDGYVVAEGLLNVEEDLQPLIDEYQVLLNQLAARFHEAGELSSTYDDLPFGERLAAILRELGGGFYQHLDISLPQKNISQGTPMHHGPAVFNLLRTPKLLDAVEEFIGPEIYSNPVQHVRVKPPETLLPDGQRSNALLAKTIWHQDQGVVREEADNSNVLTVWLPVTNATEENGCLVVAPGSHKRGLSVHCLMDSRPGIHEIPDRIVGARRAPLPMMAGDVLFMNKLTMHSSLSNLSNCVRWSLDLRYNPIGQETGRPWFPGFVARSRSNPDAELRDSDAWAETWCEARKQLADGGEDPKFQRWKLDDPLCA
jgi:hypothetical protein